MPVPSAINVNMLRLRETIDVQPRAKNGAPPHITMGVASTSSAHCAVAGGMNVWKLGSQWPPISRAITGSASARLIQNRSDMLASSGFGPSSAAGISGSSAIPQIGHEPGPSCTICGCIGHVHLVPAGTFGGTGAALWACDP